MKIENLLTTKEMEIMERNCSLTGQPDRDFMMEFIGDHYKELELKELLLWNIGRELHEMNYTNKLPEKIKEENWYE